MNMNREKVNENINKYMIYKDKMNITISNKLLYSNELIELIYSKFIFSSLSTSDFSPSLLSFLSGRDDDKLRI
mgnify:CR=1 FL=1